MVENARSGRQWVLSVPKFGIFLLCLPADGSQMHKSGHNNPLKFSLQPLCQLQ
jgi:hypothetical protein